MKSFRRFFTISLLIMVGALILGCLWIRPSTVMAEAKMPPLQAPVTSITTCGTQITTPGTYSVTVSHCSGDGIDITTSNVTLIAPFFITSQCTGGCSPSQTGILVSDPAGGPISNVRILGGGVSSFGIGVSFVGVNQSQITGVQIGNFSPICLVLSSDSQGDVSHDNLFTANTFHICTSEGVRGNSVYSSRFIGNSFDGNFSSAGIVGIHILNGTGNILTGNTCSNEAAGIELGGTGSIGATGNDLFGNTLTGNSTGILVGSASNGNTFRGNYSFRNSVLDIDEENTACGTDKWARNVFTSTNQSCVQ